MVSGRRAARAPPRPVERRRALAVVAPPGQRADARRRPAAGDSARAGAGGGANDPRDAPGARSHESLQRDRGGPAQPDGGRRAPTGLRAQRQGEHRHGDRPDDADGGRHVPGRGEPPARRAVLRPHDPLGGQQRRGPHDGQPDAGRSDDGQARAANPRRRSVQPLLHPGRPLRDGRRRGAQAARLPRPAHHGAPGVDRGAELRGREPRGLLHRRQVPDRDLRVPERLGQDRSRRPDRARLPRAASRRNAPGHPGLPGWPDLLRRRHDGRGRPPDRRRPLRRHRLPQDRDRHPRPLSEPGRQEALRGQSRLAADPGPAEGTGLRSRSSTSRPARSKRPGPCPVAGAPTWATSAPTAPSSG